MPELPEVETVARDLRRRIVGATIVGARCSWARTLRSHTPDAFAEAVAGRRIEAVGRRAKQIVVELSGEAALTIHLKMTGQLVFVGESRFGAGHPNDSMVGNLPDKSTRVTIDFDSDAHLYFNDQRKFGWMRLMPTADVPNIDFMKKVGPEPLSEDFTWETFKSRLLRRKNSNIKAVLLDQTIVAGIGNIYADECLWGAMINPATLAGSLSDTQIKLLYKEMRFVLKLAIEKGGSTNRNYVDAVGKKGSYMDFARVFRREGLGCPRCGDIVVKTRVASRGTHICPTCQQI